MTKEEERLNACQNICAAAVIIGMFLFAGAGNEMTAIIAIILIVAGSIGISVCNKKLKKEHRNDRKETKKRYRP